MRTLKMYCPLGETAPLTAFLSSLNPKLRDKIMWQLFRLSSIPRCEIKEPHFKHFVIERYSKLYELREKNRILVRIIFTMEDAGGDIILLAPFVKQQPRDTMRALDQSLKMLADIREHPEYAADFKYSCKEEKQ